MFYSELVNKAISLAYEYHHGQHNKDYLSEYIPAVKRNPIARKVKLADLAHNLDGSRFPVPNERQAKRAEKYRKALQILQD